MMKNVVDVVLGGLTYWAFGYGLSYGDSSYSNSFVALGTISGGTWFVSVRSATSSSVRNLLSTLWPLQPAQASRILSPHRNEKRRFVDAQGEDMGPVFVTFLFQLSFATTATTIVSGAMAER